MKILIIVILAAVIMPMAAFSQFGEKHVLNHGIGSIYSILPVDYDNDGDNDIFVTTVDSSLIFFENMGNDSLADERRVARSIFRIVNCADIDNDGHKELLCSRNDSIGWYENSLNNDFSVFHYFLQGSGSFYASDIDLDGDSDLFIGFYSLNKLSFFENQGSGNFLTEQVVSNTVTNINDMLFADLNNDGSLDIITTSSPQIIIERFLNDGTNQFSQQNVWNDYLADYPDEHLKPSLYDVNGDGYLDVFHSNGLMAWQQNLGNGDFDVYYQTININLNYSHFFDVSDINNDSDFEIIVGSESLFMDPNGINIQTGLWSTIQTIEYDAFYRTSYILAYDFDNDGDKDIIEGLYTGRLFWYPNDGSITSYTPLNKSSFSPSSLWAVDYDNDLDNDVVCLYDNDKFMALYENTGNGNFLSEQIILDSLRVNPHCNNSSLTDIDNDGDLDFIYLDGGALFSNNTGLYVLKNNGGLWDTIRIDTTNIYIYKVVDFNQDNYKDIVFQAQYGAGLKALINDGSGNFSTYQTVLNSFSYGYYSSFTLFDLDGDNDLDIFTTRSDTNMLQWNINNGNGTYTEVNLQQYHCTGGSMDIYPVDYDNDSDIDIVFNACCEIYLLENDGTNNFISHTLFSTNTVPVYSLEMLDIDMDGDLDIIFGNQDGTHWIKNNNGNFYPNNELIFSLGNVSVFSDIDGDNVPDIVSGSLNYEVSWFKNYMNTPLKIKGSVFYDSNQNGVRDTLEPGFLNAKIVLTPNYLATYTDSSGNYWKAVNIGNYNVNCNVPNYWMITSPYSNYMVDITPNQQIVDTCDFGIYPDSLFTSISPDLILIWGMCNNLGYYHINIKNNGTLPASGIIELTLDTLISFSASYYAQDSVVNNKVYWHFDDLNFFEELNFNILTTWPNPIFMDSTLYNCLTVYTMDSTGNILASYQDTSADFILCSYDPNDKSVEPVGVSVNHIVSENQELQYTIRFQNTGNTTALNILVEDTIDPGLDIASFEFLSASHPVRININNRLLQFYLDSIMLPDSSSDEVLSHGYIKYKIRPVSGVLPNAVIKNNAYIYFDYNPAIITDTVFNQIDCYITPPVPTIVNSSGTLIVTTPNNGAQWYYQGQLIPGAINNTYHPAQTGSYSVVIVNQYGCSSVSVPYDYTMDVDENQMNNIVSIYPNPANDEINIEWNENKVSTICIISFEGKEIYNINTENFNIAKINSSEFSKGIYFVKIIMEDSVVTKKLIIQ